MDIRHRPAYHFCPPRNWLNDPNGMIHWKGTYHLFYQYAPFSAVNGVKYWGHAASRDLAHWEHRPIALSPTPGGPDRDGIWSGCTVDWDGLPIAFYTGVFPEQQCIAVGDDTLNTWIKYSANPVIGAPPEGLAVTGFRDPCVWREQDAWYLVLGSGIEGGNGMILLYRSEDLLHWEYLHPLYVGESVETGRIFECPNFFAVDGRHVLITSPIPLSRAIYFSGDYREHRFTPGRWGEVDAGGALYAPQYMIDAQGRRLLIGWLWEERPAEAYGAAGWSGAMSLPRVLSLDSEGRLCTAVAPEVNALREGVLCQASATLDDAILPLPAAACDQSEIHARFRVEGAQQVGVEVLRSPDGAEVTRVAYDVATGRLLCDRTHASLNPETHRDVRSDTLTLGDDGLLDLRIYVDRSIVETFANERVALTSRVYPERGDSTGVAVFANGGKASLVELTVWRMGVCCP
ncbi:MAG: glycoside hydrolase family 32 protein [Anaerolineales bacterium]